MQVEYNRSKEVSFEEVSQANVFDIKKRNPEKCFVSEFSGTMVEYRVMYVYTSCGFAI